MKYLYYFFPCDTYFISFEQSLSIWWVTFVLACFLGSLLYLLFWPGKLGSVYFGLRKVVREITPDSLRACPFLKPLWDEYSATFFTAEGDWRKTPQDAARYFNFTSVVAPRLNLRYWNSVSAVLVGTGILGTFVGLIVGISDFETNSVEQIEQSIQILLSGMSTAFLTSVWGMSLSILFSIIEKSAFRSVDRMIQKIAVSLNQTYHLSRVEESRFWDRYAVYQDPQGNPVYPAFVLRDLLANSQEQTRALKAFSTDLADGIKIKDETLQQLAEAVGAAFQQSVTGSMNPLLQEIREAVEKLRQVRDESTGSYIQEITNQLAVLFRQIGENLHNALSGTAVEQLNRLADSLNQTGDQLRALPGQLSELMTIMKTSAEDNRRLITESSHTAGKSLAEQVEKVEQHYEAILTRMDATLNAILDKSWEVTKDLQDQTSQNIEEMRQDNENNRQQWNISLEKIHRLFEELNQRDKNSRSAHEGLMKGIVSTLERFSSLNKQLQAAMETTTGKLSQVTREMSGVMQPIKESSQALHTSTQVLHAATQAIRNHTDSFLTQNQKNLRELQAALSTAQTVSKDYAEKFAIIEQGLQKIFKQIQDGLNLYQTKVNDNLNENLRQYLGHFKDAAHALKGAVEDLTDIVETVQDARSQANTVRGGR
ncbi:MAG TPA: MotA/TolQ/ExbB proton channel family protein [bacterium]|nr:MotA/TolQ/ExbB proton channel family protein [bacterium]